MAVYDNRHSRRVAWLKVVLPLVALAILSTLFLVADRRGTGSQIPYSRAELDRIVNEQRIENPNYAGVTDEGSAVTVAARTVRPETGTPERMQADGLIGAIEAAGGGRFSLSAATGTLDGRVAVFDGDVVLTSSTGYRVESGRLDLLLRRAEVVSDGPVAATGPPGTLTAGAMTLSRTGDHHLLSFTDGVELVYRPQAPAEGQGK